MDKGRGRHGRKDRARKAQSRKNMVLRWMDEEEEIGCLVLIACAKSIVAD